MATSSSPPSRQANSRFSTLKVFKFGASSSKPPPPPPKDPYYLHNPSLASLHHSLAEPTYSASQPVTPISSTPISSLYASSARSPSPSPSSSYAASGSAKSQQTLTMSPSTTSLSPDSAGSRKGLFKLPSFSKRPKTPKSTKSTASDDALPPEPVEDPSISMPWNFQHNIHVDEGFAGLPPTWSASLAEMGFSPEEIAAINARRGNGRSPTLYPLQNVRSGSPYTTLSLESGFHQSTTSLRRKYSQTSFSQSQVSLSQRSDPFGSPMHSRNVSRQYSQASMSDAHSSEYIHMNGRSTSPQTTTTTSTAPSVRSPLSPPQPTTQIASALSFPDPPPTMPQPQERSTSLWGVQSVTSSMRGGGGDPNSAPSKDKPPKTPPRRVLHVANESICTISSPPPAYNNSPNGKDSGLGAVDETLVLPPSIVALPRLETQHEGSEERALSAKEERTSESGSAGTGEMDRLGGLPSIKLPSPSSTAPPRLSLHQDTSSDLDSWTESLFSIIPGGGIEKQQQHATSSRFASSSSFLNSASQSQSTNTRTIATMDNSTSSTSNSSPLKKLSRTSSSSNSTSPSSTSSHSTSTSASITTSTSTAATSVFSTPSSLAPPATSTSTKQRPIPAQKPLPLHSLPPRSKPLHLSSSSGSPLLTPTLPPEQTTPLWEEVMSMVQAEDSVTATTTGTTTGTGRSSVSPQTPLSQPHNTYTGRSKPAIIVEVDVEDALVDDYLREDDPRFSVMTIGKEKENRDSSMSTMTVTPATIVRDAAVATRARANMVHSPVSVRDSTGSLGADTEEDEVRSHSPQSSESHSSGSGSSSSVAPSLSTIPGSGAGSLLPSMAKNAGSADGANANARMSSGSTYVSYVDVVDVMESSPSPSPRVPSFATSPTMLTSAAVRQMRAEDVSSGVGVVGGEDGRPSIVVDDTPSSPSSSCSSSSSYDEEEEPTIAIYTPASATLSKVTPMTPSPLTPSRRYPGWVQTVVEPLRDFIDEKANPRELFAELVEIAEGESGSVYAARVIVSRLTSSSSLSASSSSTEPGTQVAIKQISLLPPSSSSPQSKLLDLAHELNLLSSLSHTSILRMESLYIDIIEDALWVRMELMDRSLADIIGLSGEGIVLQEKHMAQVASDVLSALAYLQDKGIAHRDVRSDNLLVRADGLVKIADFSNAVKVDIRDPIRTDPTGVIYWQAPEMRTGSYNALKVDVWSLGATVWEMAQGEPPFSNVTDIRQLGDRWDPLDQPETYSRSFHDFLHCCSEPTQSRPDPHELLNTPFIRGAGGHTYIMQLLTHCRTIEERLSRRHSGEEN